jgi:carbonic anhydrase/acetyltransferase-like protein (isoleucine patch superfamily)
MRKIIIEDHRNIDPFNEPARELRVLNKPLFLQQRDTLLRYCTERELPVKSLDQLSRQRLEERIETLVHRDNLFFDQHFIDEFIQRARSTGKACRVAFSLDDKAIVNHALYLQKGIRREGSHYVADLWYYPHGIEPYARPLVIDTEPYEAGYYRVPTYMAPEQGEMTYYLPRKAFLSIEHWTHIFIGSVVFGIFAEAARFEREANRSLKFKLKIFLQALLERKQFMSSSAAIQIGRNCTINPSASIQGPTIIGDNVTIGAGAHITHCIIGNNVNIMEGCQLMLSVVGDGCYLPFRAALLTTAVMENSIIAQNTCLQKCVVGRNSFIGAGTTFTDFNLVSDKPIRAFFDGKLQPVGTDVMGGCVGHNCRLGAGLIIHPARTVESDTVLVAKPERWVIAKNVTYEESDHHNMPGGTELHPRLYDPNIRRL